MTLREQMIENARETIQSFQTKQDECYQLLVEELDVDGEEEGWLWDYCFNCKEESDSDYYKMVKGNVYGYDC